MLKLDCKTEKTNDCRNGARCAALPGVADQVHARFLPSEQAGLHQSRHGLHLDVPWPESPLKDGAWARRPLRSWRQTANSAYWARIASTCHRSLYVHAQAEADAAKRELETAKAQHAAVVARLTGTAHLEALAACLGAAWCARAIVVAAVCKCQPLTTAPIACSPLMSGLHGAEGTTLERAGTLTATAARVAARQEQQRLDEARDAAGSSWWQSLQGALVRKSRTTSPEAASTAATQVLDAAKVSPAHVPPAAPGSGSGGGSNSARAPAGLI